jgi:hypothetical protein
VVKEERMFRVEEQDKEENSKKQLLVGCFPGILFNPENRVSTFLGNVV